MTDPNKLVLRRSLVLWALTALVWTLGLAAAAWQNLTLAYAVVALGGVSAVVGIAFGFWAGRTLHPKQRA